MVYKGKKGKQIVLLKNGRFLINITQECVGIHNNWYLYPYSLNITKMLPSTCCLLLIYFLSLIAVHITLVLLYSQSLSLTSLQLFTIAKHYFALIFQYNVARCLVLTIFHRNVILIIFTSLYLNAFLTTFCFPTLCTFCWIASQIFVHPY